MIHDIYDSDSLMYLKVGVSFTSNYSFSPCYYAILTFDNFDEYNESFIHLISTTNMMNFL